MNSMFLVISVLLSKEIPFEKTITLGKGVNIIKSFKGSLSELVIQSLDNL